MSDLSNRTMKNSVYSFFGFIWMLCLTFFTLPILIHKLGIEQYGIYIMINVLLGILAVSEFNFSYLFGKRLSENPQSENIGNLSDLFSVTFWFYLLIGVLAALFIILVGSFIPALFHLSGITAGSSWQLFFLAGIVICFQVAVMPLLAIPFAFQRFDILTKISLINLTSVQLLMVMAVFFGFDIKALFFIQAISAFVIFIVYFKIWKKFAPGLLLRRRCHFKRIFVPTFKSGFPFFLCNFMQNLLSQLDKYVLGIFGGPSSVSYYSSAQMLPNKIQNVSLSLSPVFFPVFSNIDYLQQRVRMADIFRRAVKFLIYITSGLVLVIALYGWELLRYWLGPEFALHAAFSIRILALCYFFLAIFSFLYYFLGGIKKSRFALFTVTLMAFLDVTLIFILIPKFGINGAAIAYLISVLPVIFYVFYIEKKYFGASLVDIFKNYSKLAVKIISVNLGVGLIGFFVLTKLITGLWSVLIIGGVTYVIFLVIYWMFGFIEKSDKELISNYFLTATKNLFRRTKSADSTV